MPTISTISPANGAAGDVVHIIGSGLGAVTAVHFGTTPAAFTIIDAGQVDATVPRTHGSSDTLTVVDGSGSDTGTFTVLFPGPWKTGRTTTFTVDRDSDIPATATYRLYDSVGGPAHSFADVCVEALADGTVLPAPGVAVVAVVDNESGDPDSFPTSYIRELHTTLSAWNGHIPVFAFGPTEPMPDGAYRFEQHSGGVYDEVQVTTSLTSDVGDAQRFPGPDSIQMRRATRPVTAGYWTDTLFAAEPFAATAALAGTGGETITLTGTLDTSDMNISDELRLIFASERLLSHVAPSYTAAPPDGLIYRFGAVVRPSGHYALAVTFTASRWRWLYTRPTAVPPLRQFPRDDALGGAPRQGHQSQSIQASARQGWSGSYR